MEVVIETGLPNATGWCTAQPARRPGAQPPRGGRRAARPATRRRPRPPCAVAGHRPSATSRRPGGRRGQSVKIDADRDLPGPATVAVLPGGDRRRAGRLGRAGGRGPRRGGPRRGRGARRIPDRRRTRCASSTTGRCSPRAASTGAARSSPAPSPASTRRSGTSPGRRYGAPVHALLGGHVRDRVRVYAWIGGDEPGELADAAAAQVAAGLTAVKMNACGRLAPIRTPAEVDAVVEPGRPPPARRSAPTGTSPSTSTAASARPPAPDPARAGAAAPAVRRGAGPARAGAPPARPGRQPRRSRWPPASGSTAGPTSSAALQAGRRRRPARPVARRRHLRGAPDRRAGRDLRRAARAALPARPDRPGGQPPGRLRDAELPDPGAEHRHPLQRRTPTCSTTWSTRSRSGSSTGTSPAPTGPASASLSTRRRSAAAATATRLAQPGLAARRRVLRRVVTGARPVALRVAYRPGARRSVDESARRRPGVALARPGTRPARGTPR